MRTKAAPTTTRAAANGVDLKAFKRKHAAFIKMAKARLLELEAFAVDVDTAFETDCGQFRRQLFAFNETCIGFAEYQAEVIE